MTSRNRPSLPPPQQVWSHCTNSSSELLQALENETITAVEADLLMGWLEPKSDIDAGAEPIMAHPPNRTSDLSTQMFLEQTIASRERLVKHIKLDFKEIDVVRPTLNTLRQLLSPRNVEGATQQSALSATSKAIYLNADILPGPGKRVDCSCVDALAFLETCISFANKLEKLPGWETRVMVAYSLGFKVDYQDEDDVYSSEDCQAMTDLVRRYKLNEKSGIVLALNARVLSRQPSVFDEFMREFSDAQILAWTGSGEPPIPQKMIDRIQQHTESVGLSLRIGFDCAIKI